MSSDKKIKAMQKLGVAAVDKADDPDEPQQASAPSPRAQEQPQPPGAFDPNLPTPNYGEVEGDSTHAGKNLAGVPDDLLKLFEHDASEVIMMQTTRHWIGLVGVYGGTALGIVILLVTYGFITTDQTIAEMFGLSGAAIRSIGGLVVLILTVLIGVIGLLSGYVYNKSRLILTNQKVVFINYKSLINRQISQLNIGEVEDVSVAQPNIIQRIFKTGIITIETAGEQHNYNFNYANKPHEFAHKTVQAHEGTIREYGN